MSTLHQIREFGQLDNKTEPVQIVNKRGFDPEAEECERLAKRQEIKSRRARLYLAWTRQQELTQARRQIDQELDKLASDHEQRLSATQGALSLIERRLISAISQGKPVSGEDDAERRRLLKEIDEANFALQAALKEARSKIPIVEQAQHAIMHEASQYHASERDLWDRPVSCPKLYREYLLAKDQAAWAGRRVAGLSEQREEFSDRLAQNYHWQREQVGSDYSREIARCQLLVSDVEFNLDDAHRQLTQATAESDRLRQAIIHE